MGIEPTYPSAKYGYIIPNSKDETSTVNTFKEKPTEEVAKGYIEQGALWNGGVFAYKLKYVLDKANEIIGFSDYKSLFDQYKTLEKISFDYAVVEKEEKIQVQRFAGSWKDLGTWNTLTSAMSETTIGNVIVGDNCEETHVINELDIPVFVMGIRDAVISASADGIIVSDKHQSSYIKPYVDKISGPVRFAEKSWGSYQVLDVTPESMTIKVTLNPGHQMKYHSHERRMETWTVIEGEGTVVIDGVSKKVKAGDYIELPIGTKHTVIAENCRIQLIEVQMGKGINEKDKKLI